MKAPLIVIIGETASGKSDLAMRVALSHGGELVCADSWTVRRECDIGSAKPSAADREQVPHHLLDIVGPAEDFTAAIFKQRAQQSIADIMSRGKVPILVGGTGLYIDGVLFDYNFLPEGAPGQREALNRCTIDELLHRIDAAGLTTDGIDTRNKRRLIRLLETGGAAQTKSTLRDNTLMIGLQPAREALHERITQRVTAMLAQGLEAEVAGIAERYGWDCEGLKGIGYREWREYFQGTQTRAVTEQRIISATIQLAKRQRTWFKRNKSIQWFATPVEFAQIDDVVTTFLNKSYSN